MTPEYPRLRSVVFEAEENIDNFAYKMAISRESQRAYDNLKIINRLSKLPGVRRFLNMTDTEIEILGKGYRRDQIGLSATRGGLRLEYRGKEKPSDHLWYMTGGYGSAEYGRTLDVNETEVIFLFNKVSKQEERLAQRLAKMKPERIIKKFKKAVSSPIRIN